MPKTLYYYLVGGVETVKALAALPGIGISAPVLSAWSRLPFDKTNLLDVIISQRGSSEALQATMLAPKFGIMCSNKCGYGVLLDHVAASKPAPRCLPGEMPQNLPADLIKARWVAAVDYLKTLTPVRGGGLSVPTWPPVCVLIKRLRQGDLCEHCNNPLRPK